MDPAVTPEPPGQLGLQQRRPPAHVGAGAGARSGRHTWALEPTTPASVPLHYPRRGFFPTRKNDSFNTGNFFFFFFKKSNMKKTFIVNKLYLLNQLSQFLL